MPAHRVTRIQLVCAYTPCAKSFEVTPGDADRVRYCSPVCRRLARQQPRTNPVTLLCAYTPCSKPFEVMPWQAKTWKYCAPECYHLACLTQTYDAFTARFWDKVDKTPGHGPKGECWLWTAALHGQGGYGNFRATPYKEGNVSAHVASWFLKTGEWPTDGWFVCHECDVNACVNPVHLFLGTHSDNMQDMIAKGRDRSITHPELVLRGDAHPARLHPERMARGNNNGMRLHPEAAPRGDHHGMSKITESQFTEAMALYETGQWTFKQLGQRFGVTGAAISGRIKRHKLYLQKHHNSL